MAKTSSDTDIRIMHLQNELRAAKEVTALLRREIIKLAARVKVLEDAQTKTKEERAV